MTRFIEATAIRDALSEAGVGRGDTALVHSDALVAAQLPPLPDSERLDLLIGALESALGPNGTLVMPAFSYSFTRNEPFDVRNTPSEVGMLTEHFRRKTGVCRSQDPIFSMTAKGRNAGAICSASVRECFGTDSAFAVLHRLNSHIICLGCPFTSGGTFVHYVEKRHGVDYRYDKTFSGTVLRPDGTSASESVVYYVRDLQRKSGADLRRLQRRLEDAGRLKKAAVGRVRVLGTRASDFYKTAMEMLHEDPVSLIEEGAAH